MAPTAALKSLLKGASRAAKSMDDLVGAIKALASKLDDINVKGLTKNLDNLKGTVKNIGDLNFDTLVKKLGLTPKQLKTMGVISDGGEAVLDNAFDVLKNTPDFKKARAALDLGDAADTLENAATAVKGAKTAKQVTVETLANITNQLVTAGIVYGGVNFVLDHFEDNNEATRECINLCLPKNWDAYYYADGEKPELQYRTQEELQQTYQEEYGEDPPFDFPLCESPNTSCGDKCKERCDERYENALEVVTNAAVDAGDDLLAGLRDALGLDGLGDNFKYVLFGLVAVVILIVVLMLAK